MPFPSIRFAFVLFILLTFASCNNAEKIETTPVMHLSNEISFISNKDEGHILKHWSKENQVVFHVSALPDDLHPCNGNSSGRAFINNYTQAKLLATDIKLLTLRPELVKYLPTVSADERSFTYELRDEPTWDNGKQVSVEDVIFTFKANLCPLTNNPAAKTYLRNLLTIQKNNENPRKFTLVMKERYLQNTVFLNEIPILQKEYFDPQHVLDKFTLEEFSSPNFNAAASPEITKWAEEFNHPKYGHVPENIVGLGPYQIASWQNGQNLVLKKKKKHWTYSLKNKSDYENSFPEQIIVKLIQDENTQQLEFKNQSLDASTWLSTKALLNLQKDATFNQNYFSHFTDSYDYTYMAFNLKPDGAKHKKYFTDVRVRKALAYLTPIDQFIQLVFDGKAGRMASLIVPAKKSEYNNNLQLIPLDVEKAKKLLDAAGWKDSDGDKIRDKMIDGTKIQLSFDLNFMAGPSFIKDIVQLICESIYQAGVKANPQALDFALFYEKAQQHDFDAMLGAWSSSCFPDDFTQTWHSSSWASHGSNYTGFGNPESDALIDSIKVTLKDEVRIPMVKRLQEIIYEQQPYVFLYSAQRKNVIHKRFSNANMFYERPGVMLNNLRVRND